MERLGNNDVDVVLQVRGNAGLNAYDNVSRPEHYLVGGLEVIDILKAKMTTEQFKGFLQGNILKYVLRYETKNGVEDLKKAQWYLTYLTNFIVEKSEKK